MPNTQLPNCDVTTGVEAMLWEAAITDFEPLDIDLAMLEELSPEEKEQEEQTVASAPLSDDVEARAESDPDVEKTSKKSKNKRQRKRGGHHHSKTTKSDAAEAKTPATAESTPITPLKPIEIIIPKSVPAVPATSSDSSPPAGSSQTSGAATAPGPKSKNQKHGQSQRNANTHHSNHRNAHSKQNQKTKTRSGLQANDPKDAKTSVHTARHTHNQNQNEAVHGTNPKRQSAAAPKTNARNGIAKSSKQAKSPAGETEHLLSFTPSQLRTLLLHNNQELSESIVTYMTSQMYNAEMLRTRLQELQTQQANKFLSRATKGL